MSISHPDPDPAITGTIKDLDFRIHALSWLFFGSIGLASLYLVLGVPFVAYSWNDVGPAAPFGLGLVLLDGCQVMIVAIGATSGHRTSSRAARNMAEMLARREKRDTRRDAREIQLEKTSAERAAQIDALAEVTRRNTAQLGGVTEKLADVTEQLAGVMALLEGGADQLGPRREYRR